MAKEERHILLFPKPDEWDSTTKYSTIAAQDYTRYKSLNQTFEVAFNVLTKWVCDAQEVKCRTLNTLTLSSGVVRTAQKTDYAVAKSGFTSPLRVLSSYATEEGENTIDTVSYDSRILGLQYNLNQNNWTGDGGGPRTFPAGLYFMNTFLHSFDMYENKFYYIDRTEPDSGSSGYTRTNEVTLVNQSTIKQSSTTTLSTGATVKSEYTFTIEKNFPVDP